MLFVILGGLLSSPIFIKLLVGKNENNNPKKSGPGAKRMRGTVILGRPGGMRGASGGLYGVQELEELERIWNEIRIGIYAPTHRPPYEGAADLNVSADWRLTPGN